MTFPAADDVGSAALKAIEPWLCSPGAGGLAMVNGALTDLGKAALDDEDPRWEWFHSDVYPNLYLWGGVGSGKTGLAWSLLRARVLLSGGYEERGEQPPVHRFRRVSLSREPGAR
jgi:hypothetical protein